MGRFLYNRVTMDTREVARRTFLDALRGNITERQFEKWLYATEELESLVGHALYIELLSFDYGRLREAKLRAEWNLSLREAHDRLRPYEMAKDVTDMLLEARKRAGSWSVDQLPTLLRQRELGGLDVDIDQDESWATVRNRGDIVALVRRDMPLVVIVAAPTDPITMVAWPDDLVVLRSSEDGEGYYKVDPSKTETIFPGSTWSGAVDPMCFTLGDLWYATAP